MSEALLVDSIGIQACAWLMKNTIRSIPDGVISGVIEAVFTFQ
jgi:hypothetical protein